MLRFKMCATTPSRRETEINLYFLKCACEHRHPRRVEERIRSPGARVAGGCETPNECRQLLRFSVWEQYINCWATTLASILFFGWICLTQCWCSGAHLALTWALGIGTYVLMLAQKALYLPSHLPALAWSVINIVLTAVVKTVSLLIHLFLCV